MGSYVNRWLIKDNWGRSRLYGYYKNLAWFLMILELIFDL